MNNIEKKILESLKWKKSPAYCAARLGISESEYSKIKNKLRRNHVKGQSSKHYNLEKGEAKLDALVSYEPKSPAEIIKLLNIDSKEWKLSSYWNKQVAGRLENISSCYKD